MGLGGRGGGADGSEVFLPDGVEGWEPVGVEAGVFLAAEGWEVFLTPTPGLKKK